MLTYTFDPPFPSTLNNDSLNPSRQIMAQLETDCVTVHDTSGDGQHVAIDVVAEVFEGKTQVQRQRMVYKAIWEELQVCESIDTLSLSTSKHVA